MHFSPLSPMPRCQSHSHDLVRHWVQECAKSAGELQPSSQVPVQPVCRRRQQRAWGGFLVGGQHSGMERRHGREGVPWSSSPPSLRTHTHTCQRSNGEEGCGGGGCCGAGPEPCDHEHGHHEHPADGEQVWQVQEGADRPCGPLAQTLQCSETVVVGPSVDGRVQRLLGRTKDLGAWWEAHTAGARGG